MRRASMATITNVSLWETIRRSLATSFITLLPVAALFLYGGATLQGLRVRADGRHRIGRLLVDLHRGAAPMYVKEREPEYARRKGEIVTKRGLEEAMEESEEELAQEPAPALARLRPSTALQASAAAAKREQRRQRRRARPHGRAR